MERAKKNKKRDCFASGAAAQPRWLAGHRAGTGHPAGEEDRNSRERAEPLSLEMKKKEKEMGKMKKTGPLSLYIMILNRSGSLEPDRFGSHSPGPAPVHFFFWPNSTFFFNSYTPHITACTSLRILFLFLSCILFLVHFFSLLHYIFLCYVYHHPHASLFYFILFTIIITCIFKSFYFTYFQSALVLTNYQYYIYSPE